MIDDCQNIIDECSLRYLIFRALLGTYDVLPIEAALRRCRVCVEPRPTIAIILMLTLIKAAQ